MKTTVKTLTTKEERNNKDSKDTIIRVTIPRSDVEQFTEETIKKNKVLFKRLAKA
ncbi:MAG: hypothetical protein ACRD4J_04530 [Nitrososphaeraceae archaeon]